MTTIDVDFRGNESDLVGAFDKVGSASKKMSDQVDDAGSRMASSGEAFDGMADRADTAETRFTGFYDTLGGTRDALSALSDESLSTSDRLIALGQAGADLSGGLVGFVIPAVKSMWQRLIATTAATWAVNTAQKVWALTTKGLSAAMAVLNAVMKANPIMFIVGLITVLVSAFYILWQRSAGFRNFFIGMWRTIQSVVGSVVNWIKGAWNGIVTFFSRLPGRILGFFRSLGSGIANIFKGAVNVIIDLLNGGIGLINSLIHGINNVSGIIGIPAIPDIPKIPRLHAGGTVPGPTGQEVLTVLQAGEHVSMNGQGSGGRELRVAPGADKGVAELINYLIRKRYIQVV